MCCNGVLFFGMKLQASDSAKALRSLGLAIKRKDNQLHCLQPCRAHHDGACQIYSQRPVRCREFECKQLVALAHSECTELEALARINQARQLATRVEELFVEAKEERMHKDFSTRYAAVFTPPLDPAPEAETVRTKLKTAMDALETFLSLHFRAERQTAD